ncbi:MAG: pyridoxal phosphate-dependent aminotransferase family protein [Raineya sp.]
MTFIPILSQLQEKLDKRLQEGNLRSLKSQTNLVDFCSNDYLGLARNKEFQEIVLMKMAALPQPHLGATGSRLISGTHPYMLETEEFLAQMWEAEAALVFNSGYQLNTALLATIPQKGDTILSDQLIHASLREGARLSLAQRYYFKHNDLADLEAKMRRSTGNIFVVAESVYSMDGDQAPIAEIIALCKKYNAYLIVDEAHSTGIYGKYGEGWLYENNWHQEVFARIYTFGKAIGGHGACIVGSKILISYLINFARAFIYTTALPLHTWVHIREAFGYIYQNNDLQKKLEQNIQDFRQMLGGLPNLKESTTPIQIIQIGGNERTKKFAQILQNSGFDVRAVLSPTVQAGEEIVRICLHSFNTSEQIQELCGIITETIQQFSEK